MKADHDGEGAALLDPKKSCIWDAIAIFGFLFIPAPAARFTNAYLATEIELFSIWLHFILAASIAGLVLLLTWPEGKPEEHHKAKGKR